MLTVFEGPLQQNKRLVFEIQFDTSLFLKKFPVIEQIFSVYSINHMLFIIGAGERIDGPTSISHWPRTFLDQWKEDTRIRKESGFRWFID